MKTHPSSQTASSLLAIALLTSVVSAQNVGIGTTTPKSKLSVNGSTAAGGIAVGDASYTSTTGTVAPLNGAIIQGNTGIGTPTPGQLLHVVDGNILRENSNGNASTFITTDGGVRVFRNGPALVSPTVNGYVDVRNDSAGGTSYGRMYYYKGVAGQAAPLNAGEGLGFGAGTSTNAAMLIEAETGRVGINDLTPSEAQLVVRGGVSGSGGAGKTFNEASVNLGNQGAFSPLISIFASNVIAAGTSLVANGSVIAASSLTPSDSRLKNIIGPSDATADLELLKKIRITDYTMKDGSLLGEQPVKKVIAQQVEEVYPAAISKTTGYLPDVRAKGRVSAKSDGSFEISMESPHGLATGDRVKLMHPNGEPEFATVTGCGENSFTAKLEMAKDGGEVLVYGRQVNDLRTVDYDALSMLNISATQELARKMAAIEAENAELKAQCRQVVSLQAENEHLKAQVEGLGKLADRMAALEKLVAANPSTATKETMAAK